MAKYKVGLDAGHAITTAGKRSFDETLREYEFNRDISNRIKYYLELTGMFEVILSVPTDEDATLAERTKIFNDAGCDIVVSIHANAYGDTWNTARGWEIYVYKKTLEGSMRLANAIHNASIPYLNIPDRGIKEADFYIVHYTNMDAVLIEHGFYTNWDECQLLKDNDFREKCAIADSQGICEYFGVSFVEKPIDPPLKEYPTGTPIMGESIATVDQLYAYAINANPNPQVNKDFYAFCNAFLEIGKQEGVRGDIAFCQSCKETGFFKFDGDALPEWNNYAGLGVTGAKDENGIPVGEKFETPEIGILAQIQHLKAYACEEPLNTECVDNRFKYIRRGRSPYWEWLGKMENPKNVDGIYPPEEQQGWAVQGWTYGHDIINMYNEMITLPTDDPNIPLKKEEDAPINDVDTDTETLVNLLGLLKDLLIKLIQLITKILINKK